MNVGNAPEDVVESLAEALCDERWGEGTYKAKGLVKRSYWRREARKSLRTVLQEINSEYKVR